MDSNIMATTSVFLRLAESAETIANFLPLIVLLVIMFVVIGLVVGLGQSFGGSFSSNYREEDEEEDEELGDEPYPDEFESPVFPSPFKGEELSKPRKGVL